MKYDDMDCGIRVVTPMGAGVVVSYDSDLSFNLFGAGRRGFVRNTSPKNASVRLDSGGTTKVRISKLKKEE